MIGEKAQTICLSVTLLLAGPTEEPLAHQRPISTSPEEQMDTQWHVGTQITDSPEMTTYWAPERAALVELVEASPPASSERKLTATKHYFST